MGNKVYNTITGQWGEDKPTKKSKKISNISSNIQTYNAITGEWNNSILPTKKTLSENSTVLPIRREEQYVDTGKRYGDYFYQDYATRRNDKIYSKGGKYYVFNSKTNQYEDIDSSSKSTITTVEEQNRQKEEAKKLGYKDYYEEQDKKIKKLEDKYNSLNKKYDDNINIYTAPEKVSLMKEISKAKKALEQAEKNNKYLSVSDRINLDTGNLTKKEYKEYSEDLQRQREKIENEQAEKRRVRYSGTGEYALKEIGTKAGDIAYPINKEVIEPIKYSKENYDIGKQNNKLALEYYNKMEGKKNNAEELEQKINKFNRYNQDLITKPGAAGTSIQNMNTQVESLKRSWWAALPGAAIGGVGGFFGGGPVGAVVGAEKGFKTGYTLGSAPYTYKLEAGNTYKDLTEQGIPKNIAKDLARKTGVINAAIESGEKVLDIITWGRAGKLKDASEQMLYDELKKEYGEKALKTFLVKAGYSYAQNVASESMEEMAQEGTSILAEREAYKKAGMDRQVTDEEDIKRILAAGKSAAISTAFTAPLTAGAGTISQSVFNNLRTQAINNVNTLTNTDIDTELTNQIINYSKENNTNLTEGEVLQIKEDIKNNLEQNNITVIDNQQNNTVLPTVQDIVNQERTNQDINLPTRDNINQQNNVYQYQTSGNEKIDNLRKSAVENNFNNSESTINYMNMLEQIITDKNVDILFDPNLKDSQGRMANGKYENGVITINPNSNRAGEFIAIHELTHAIGTDQMKDIIERYRKSNAEFDTAVQQLLKNYNVDEINEEAMADVAGQLFGNQEFINNLAQTQPSLFRKIYNTIMYYWHQFRGYKNQNEFIEDLQYKWEKAYRSNAELNNVSSYLLSENALQEVTDVATETREHAESNSNQFVKLKDNTIKTLVDYGISDNPMMAKRGHVRENVLTSEQAQKLGYSIKNKHFHGLGVKTYLEIIDSMDNPLGVYQYTNKGMYGDNNFIVLTPVKVNGKNAIVPVIINQRGQYNNVEIDYNRIKTTYSKNNDNYINNLLKQGKIKEIFTGSDSQQTSLTANNIPQINKNVKSDTSSTKYSIQESQNNKQELNNSSFSLGKQLAEGTYKTAGVQINDEIISQAKSGNYKISDLQTRYSKFVKEHNSDFDNYLKKGTKSGYYIIDNNLVKLTTTTENSKIFIDELYVEKQNQGTGTKVVESLLDYAEQNGYTLETSKELSTAKGFWDKVLNRQNKEVTNIKDNKGRTLSKQQQDFFKDSKIKDDNGNLLEVYHGTNNDFTVFDKSYLGSASGDVGFLGDGFYFSTHKGEADYYGGKSIKTYLNVTNPYNIQDLHKYKGMNLRGEDSNPYIEIKNLVDMNPEWKDIKIKYGNTYGDIANATDEILNSISVEDLGETDNGHQYKVNVGNNFDIVNTINNYSIDELKADAFTREMRDKFGFINSSDVIQDITDEARMRKLNNQKPVKTFSEVLEENGYDGIIQGEKASDTDEIVVFNPNQIKNVDNLNPTKHEDIRYSKNTEEWKNYLDENFKSEKNDNYKGSHQIEDSKRITELDLNDIQDKVVEINGYLTKQDNTDLNKLKKILKSPNEKVKIYRAAPVNELNDGDWITTDKSYAKNVADNNGGKVYEFEVDPNQLFYPDNIKELPSLHRLSSFQYKTALTEQLENQGTKIMQNAINKREGMIENFKTYLEENDITNPTQQDIDDSLTDILGYDNEQTEIENARDENLYNKYVREYMKENNIPFNENNKITKDNEGRNLTKEQQDYFKNSKVKDDAGNLLTVYHGTENAGFNEFNKNYNYYTNNKLVAETYTGNKGIYKGYLNIENPTIIDAHGETWSKIDINNIKIEGINNVEEFLHKYGSSTWKESGKTRTSTADLVAAIYDAKEDGKINSDGIIIKNIYDEGMHSSNIGKQLGNDYITFNSNQFKNINNLKPTTSKDIRFSKNNETWQDYLESNFESKNTTKFKDMLLPTKKDINKVNLPTNEDMNLLSLESTAPTEENNTLDYIPQDPTRESSYDNDAPNFWELDNNKDSLSDPITEFARALDREIEENTKTPKQIKETNNLKSKAETMWSDFQEKFVNRNYEIDKLAKKSGNKEIMFKGDMLNSVAGETSGDINVAQTDNNGKRIGGSLKSLFENSKKKGYYEQFDDYLKHYSNIDRHGYGKGSVVPLDYSQKMVKAYEQSIPGIKNEANKVWKYGKNLLNNMEENGLISKELRGTLEELYPHYVPYMQSESMVPYMDDSGEIKPKKVIKSAKGGADNLITIEEAFEKYTYATKKAIRQNDLYKEIVKTSKEKVSFGADDRVDPTQLDGSLMKDAEGNGYVTAYVDGMQQQAKVSDNLYQELTKTNEMKVKETEAKYSPIVKPLQKISEVRRNILTTWNPSFIATNAIKDIQDGLFNSKYTTDMVKNYPSAFIELATQNTETAQQFASLYGSGMVMGDYQIDSLSKAAKNMDINQLNKLIKALPNANEIVELAPRYAEFKASLQNGCSVTEAMYNAREITTNFNRGGYITKALNRDGFTFLNASVQGFDKLIRNITGVNGSKGVVVGVAGIMTKVAALGIAPAMFNAMAFGEGEDDEDEAYKALPDYIKDNYYLFKIKGIKAKNSKYYDGEFLRIPKGRVLSIFGSAARRTLEYSKGDKNAFDGYLKNVESQVGINNPEENNIIAPIKQAFGSKNGEAWYGGDLVPKRLQNKPVTEQYDEGTDEFSKWLGKMINVSPYKINYLLDQYSGGAGDIVLPMITKETTNGATTTKDYLIAPIKDKFIVNSTDDNKYASKFYTKLETMQTKNNAYNVSETDKLKYKYMSSISSDMSKLYKEKREIQLDDSLSKKQKYKKVQSVQKEINKLAEDGIKEPKIKDLKSHYVKVENTEYYKNSKGSWTTIKDEEASELNSLRMSANEKSNYFKVKNKIGAIRTSDIESSEKKDKISNLIVNMNMSDDKLAYLYGKYYSNEKTLDMIQNAGISMKEFIKYNNQSFESNYYNNGRVVKNSKLAKIINYVNTLNLNVAQKAILIKMKSNSYKKYDKQIVEYLNNQNISYLDKVTILKKIGFKAYDKQIVNKVNNMNISKEEKIKLLKDMGFTIRNGRVYS